MKNKFWEINDVLSDIEKFKITRNKIIEDLTNKYMNGFQNSLKEFNLNIENNKKVFEGKKRMIDSLKAINIFSDQILGKFADEFKDVDNLGEYILIDLNRSISKIVKEIIVMLEHGFMNVALTRLRSMTENAIIIDVLAQENDDTLFLSFLNHTRLKILEFTYKHISNQNGEFEIKKKEIVDKYYSDFPSQYGWYLDNPKITLKKLALKSENIPKSLIASGDYKTHNNALSGFIESRLPKESEYNLTFNVIVTNIAINLMFSITNLIDYVSNKQTYYNEYSDALVHFMKKIYDEMINQVPQS